MPPVVLVHVLALVVFVVFHAVSAVSMFQVRAEPDRAKLTSILNRSGWALIVAGIAILVALIAGIVAAFIQGVWNKLWIWISLILLIAAFGAMTPLAGVPMRNVRIALGMQMGKPKAGEAPAVPLSDAELATARAALRPEPVASMGVAALVIITWLMYAKPF